MCFRPSPARRDTHFILTFCGAFAAVSILRPLLSTLPLLPPLPSVGVSTPFPSFHLTASRTKPIQGRASHWGLVQCAVSSISRLQYHTPPPAFSPAKLKKPFSFREHIENSRLISNYLQIFIPDSLNLRRYPQGRTGLPACLIPELLICLHFVRSKRIVAMRKSPPAPLLPQAKPSPP